MKHFDEFMTLTGHQPLRDPCSSEALAYNENVMAEYAVWLSVKPSGGSGKPVSHSTAEQYVSMAKAQFMQKALTNREREGVWYGDQPRRSGDQYEERILNRP